jgi:hypothetical protein
MFRSVTVQRSPALALALLAVFGLLLRTLPAPAAATEMRFAAFTVPLCHAGTDSPRHRDRPGADCSACLLCMAVHGDHAGMPLLPRGADLAITAAGSPGGYRPVDPASPRSVGSMGAWARAPPAMT